MENCIKESQLSLFSDRTSCSDFTANQFRVLLSGLAYILMTEMRRVYLKETKLAKSSVGTIREKILRIGAIIQRNTRKVEFLLTNSYPLKEIFEEIHKKTKNSIKKTE